MNSRVLLLAGTRPEAVKIAPVALALDDRPELGRLVVHSGQHESMVHQALEPFGITPDIELVLRRTNGSQAELAAGLLPALDDVIVQCGPSAIVVQGDTTTAAIGALAAFWRRVPVVHLEAGLRTGDLSKPFPEEANRQMIARIASLHLAPTVAAAGALRRENVPRRNIVVTGNTVVDAVKFIANASLEPRNGLLAAFERECRAAGRRTMLVTIHRRESWGAPLARILSAVREIVARHEDLFVVLPAHPNPAVAEQVRTTLGGEPRVGITEPLAYQDLVRVLARADIVLTDSGGIQEEAPSFGVPVLVARETTERLEAVHAGCAWLVGTDERRIVAEASRLLCAGFRFPADQNPYGDGHAAARVVEALDDLIGVSNSETVDMPRLSEETLAASHHLV